jgi:ABC-type cobalamin/Fe3+-siderophores transport system ATPase subunit
MISTKDILTTSNLSIGYKTKHSAIPLPKTSAEHRPETSCLHCGANGIGKSTLLRTIMGFRNRFQGTILLNGKTYMK